MEQNRKEQLAAKIKKLKEAISKLKDKHEIDEARIMDRDALVNAYYVSSTGDRHKVAEGIPYYLLDKLIPLLTKKYAITMKDIEVRPANQQQYRRSSQPELAEDNDPCWDNYKQIGMKEKDGKKVPNCVPKESTLNEFAPDEGGGSRKFIPWTEFIEQLKQILQKDFSCKENIVKSTIKARFIPHDPMEFGPTMLYSYYETRAGGRNKGAISTRGSIQVGKYTKGGLFGHAPDQLLTGFHLLKGHPFERHFDLTFDNIYKIANIINSNTEGALEFQPQEVEESHPNLQSNDSSLGREVRSHISRIGEKNANMARQIKKFESLIKRVKDPVKREKYQQMIDNFKSQIVSDEQLYGPKNEVYEDASIAQPGQLVQIIQAPRILDLLPGETFEVRASNEQGVTLKHGMGTKFDNVIFPHGTYKIIDAQGLREFAPNGFDGFEDDNRVPMHFIVEKDRYNRRSKWKKSYKPQGGGIALFTTKQEAMQAAEKYNKLDPNREFAYGGTQMVQADDDLDETKVSKYKDLGATKDTTHFIKNVTTGEIMSPHRGKQDAEDALVSYYRGPSDGNEYKIVRARKEGLDEVSDKTLTSYLTKVDADSRKHKMDPTKRSPEKASKSVKGFSQAFNKLDARKPDGSISEDYLDE